MEGAEIFSAHDRFLGIVRLREHGFGLVIDEGVQLRICLLYTSGLRMDTCCALWPK